MNRPPPSPEDALVKEAQKERVVERLGERIARRARPRLGYDDLLQIGYLKLVEVARVFDAARRIPFPWFAWGRVRGAMLHALRSERRQTRSAMTAACRYLDEQRIEGDMFTDTDDDHRRRLEALSDGMLSAMFAATVSDASRGDAGASEEATVDRVAWRDAVAALHRALDRLAKDARELIDAVYMRDVELKEYGAEKGVAYITVRRQHQRALEHLALALLEQGVADTDVLPAREYG